MVEQRQSCIDVYKSHAIQAGRKDFLRVISSLTAGENLRNLFGRKPGAVVADVNSP